MFDVREPAEFAQARLPDSINVPRGVLVAACGWNDFEQQLVDGNGHVVATGVAEPLLAARVRPDPMRPA